MLAAVVQIPVTVKLDNVKVVRREKEEGEIRESNAEEIKKDESSADEEVKINKDYEEPKGGLIPDDY